MRKIYFHNNIFIIVGEDGIFKNVRQGRELPVAGFVEKRDAGDRQVSDPANAMVTGIGVIAYGRSWKVSNAMNLEH